MQGSRQETESNLEHDHECFSSQKRLTARAHSRLVPDVMQSMATARAVATSRRATRTTHKRANLARASEKLQFCSVYYKGAKKWRRHGCHLESKRTRGESRDRISLKASNGQNVKFVSNSELIFVLPVDSFYDPFSLFAHERRSEFRPAGLRPGRARSAEQMATL